MNLKAGGRGHESAIGVTRLGYVLEAKRVARLVGRRTAQEFEEGVATRRPGPATLHDPPGHADGPARGADVVPSVVGIDGGDAARAGRVLVAGDEDEGVV